MLKNSLAISALLTTSKVNSKHFNVKTSQSLLETSESGEPVRNLEADYLFLGNDALNVIDDDAYLDVSSGLSFTPTSCTSGIERFESGVSNTEAAYTAATAGAALWEDPEFGADDTSLSWGRHGFGREYDAPPYGLKWKRPSEMTQCLCEKASLWGSLGKPLPYGVHQGQLGDCWFLAAASSLAEEPHRIQSITTNKEYSQHGIFRFKFYIQGKWVWINIDDRLPITSWGDQVKPWATQKSENGAWWMPLLEKAFAKLNQNYDRIIGGNGAEGLKHLSGMPTFSVKHEGKKKKLLQMHKFWTENNFPATASCCNRVRGGIKGLVSGHAYSFLDVQDLKDASGNVKHTIAKIRNPWGKEKYYGPFSDKSKMWTDEWKKQVNYVKADDGIFWMKYYDFIKMFYKADVAFYGDYKTAIHTYKASQRQQAIPFTNPADQKVYIMGEMYSERHYPRKWRCQPNNNVLLFLTDKNYQDVESFIPYQFIATWGFGTVGKLKGDLPAGDYILTIVNQNHPSGPNDITFNIYASQQLPTFEGMA